MELKFSDIHNLASNNWERIHRALGVAPANTSHLKHTPCPCCGGRDRFRVTNRYAETGGWICSQGGGDTTGGDGFALLQHYGLPSRRRNPPALAVGRMSIVSPYLSMTQNE